MLKISRTANGEVVFRLSGRIGAEGVAELARLFDAYADGRRIVLDLKDLNLVDREAVIFLAKCEGDLQITKTVRRTSESGSGESKWKTNLTTVRRNEPRTGSAT